jgi:hypothetical protein
MDMVVDGGVDVKMDEEKRVDSEVGDDEFKSMRRQGAFSNHSC